MHTTYRYRTAWYRRVFIETTRAAALRRAGCRAASSAAQWSSELTSGDRVSLSQPTRTSNKTLLFGTQPAFECPLPPYPFTSLILCSCLWWPCSGPTGGRKRPPVAAPRRLSRFGHRQPWTWSSAPLSGSGACPPVCVVLTGTCRPHAADIVYEVSALWSQLVYRLILS